MDWKRVTRWVIIVTVVVLIAIDIILGVNGGVDATISRVLLAASRRQPIIALSAGILVGHLFVPRNRVGTRIRQWIADVPIFGIGIGVLLGHLFLAPTPLSEFSLAIFSKSGILTLALGVLVGTYCWGQPKPKLKVVDGD